MIPWLIASLRPRPLADRLCRGKRVEDPAAGSVDSTPRIGDDKVHSSCRPEAVANRHGTAGITGFDSVETQAEQDLIDFRRITGYERHDVYNERDAACRSLDSQVESTSMSRSRSSASVSSASTEPSNLAESSTIF